MENIWLSRFSWGDFLQIALVLIAVYFVLQFLQRVLRKTNFLGRFQEWACSLVHHLLLVYELIVILLLGAAFVLIYPAFHGLLLLILVIGGFSHIRNYISGRVMQFDGGVSIGKQLKIDTLQGIITHIGRLGLQLKTNKGSQFINYSKLMDEGYLLLSGKEIGGFYNLKISPENIENGNNHLQRLIDLLATAPYLDTSHKTELLTNRDQDNQWNAKVLVKEESHLFDLIDLLREWGYVCKISKK